MAVKRSIWVQRLAKVAPKNLVYSLSDRFIRKRMTTGRDQVNSNRIQRFKESTIHLNDVQKRIMDHLGQEGFAAIDVRELVGPDNKLLKELEADVTAWANSEEVLKAKDHYQKLLDEGSADGTAHNRKLYELKRYPKPGTKIDVADPILQFVLQPEILDVVNSYHKLNTIISHVDQWRTLANQGKVKRNASQNWHRDPEDTRILKLFLYMKDIPPAAGPFEYVLNSRNGDKYANVGPQQLPYGSEVDDAMLRKSVPNDRIIAASYPKYTLLFVDTTGIHRGGFAVEEDRLLCTWAFNSLACPYYRYVEPVNSKKLALTAAQKDALFEN
jgi:hypothetical protein